MVGAQEWLVIASVSALAFGSLFEGRNIAGRSTAAILASCVGLSIWTVVSAVSLVALSLAGSNSWELLIPLTQMFSTFGLLVVSVKVVHKRRAWKREHWPPGSAWLFASGAVGACCLAGVVAGVMLQNPIVVLVGNFVANLVGLVPMLVGAQARPNEVVRPYWTLRGLSTSIASGLFLQNGNYAALLPQVSGLIIPAAMLYVSRGLRQRPRAFAAPIKASTVLPLVTGMRLL